MDPASREGEGRGWRERRRRGPGFFFILASSFPPLLRAAAARARSRPPVPAGARPGPVSGARPPADWPFPVASPPGSQAPPRTRGRGRMSPRAAPRTRGPTRSLLPGPRGRAEETRGRSGTILAESSRARRGSRPPSRPECGIGGVRLEGTKMALGLARCQGWWRSCSAGAIFPGGAGGALRGRFAGRGAGRSGAAGSYA
ncbi:translation initiation factor IF-2-like [Mirounga leonina]|uniref:translation initiation factor IF-2-like n=1 Tax=Mirounga leonina TaxID=9715 RepID=UPI00156C5064|nr:translation initiation factor IF-2-like [Mirounga leonina]